MADALTLQVRQPPTVRILYITPCSIMVKLHSCHLLTFKSI